MVANAGLGTLLRRLVRAAPLLLLAGCHWGELKGAFRPVVNRRLAPVVASLPDPSGRPQRVAASRDARGVQTDFIEGIVLVRPRTPEQLGVFLRRVQGNVIRDDTIPAPPSRPGVRLRDEQRNPTEYVVRIDPARIPTSRFAANGRARGLTGTLEFSSLAGLQTMAAVADAVASGLDASADFVDHPQQTFPVTLFSTQERPNPAGGFTDAFATTRFGTGGSQSNVTLAWQFLAAHGIQRRVRVAVLDGGFLLNPDGTPQGGDSDFPANPAQYDFVQGDYFADGPNVGSCGAGNPCCWHGTGSAGVATGIINNQLGAAGTGGLVSDPILLKINGQRSQSNWAIRTAIAWGADVVSMSWGGDCNQACRIYDRDHTPFDDALTAGSRAVFVASAGNGDSAGNGYDVGADHLYHPCIEDHVICVGALNDDATTKTGYSNFGARVNVFAPTNIPVMSRPSQPSPLPMNFSCATPAPATAGTFGGTSAAAPFVAGVAAMMKAINPNLSSDDVANLLATTAHPGAPPVNRYVDAYQAVRRVADGIPMVKDRFDALGPGNDIQPTDLGTAGSYNQANLNVDGRDRDYFKLQAPSSSTMTVDLQYPEPLATLRVFDAESLGDCGMPGLVSDADLAGKGQRFTYTVPGGPLRLGIDGTDVDAYNLAVNFAAPAIAPDGYEPDDTPASARRLFTLTPAGSGLGAGISIDPRAEIEANIHAAADVDYYRVRGARPTLAEQVRINAFPALKVYGNESPITLDVFRLNPDNTPGALVASASAGSCATEPLLVRLAEDEYYLVKVAGGVGRYALSNGVDGARRRIPELVHDRVYVVLHPGEPVEHDLRGGERYVLTPGLGHSALRLTARDVHMRLFDVTGNAVAEGEPGEGGLERLSLSGAPSGETLTLQLVPRSGFTPQPMKLEWEAATPLRSSENLVRNPGAEIAGRSARAIPQWRAIPGLGRPSVSTYSDQTASPSPSTPGPPDRGLRLFSGGRNRMTGIQQSIPVDPGWGRAIESGRVQATFSAYLGGLLTKPDSATAVLTFRGKGSRGLGHVGLPPVTSIDRDGQTGLFPVRVTAEVPAGTTVLVVDVRFLGSGSRENTGFADDVSLVLSEYDRR